MANANTTTRFDAHQAAAEVHLNNYNSAREHGATHQEAFNKANNAVARFWRWLISLGVVTVVAVLVFMVNWSGQVVA